MRNYIATLAVIIFALTLLGAVNADTVKKEKVVIGRSDKAFKKNEPQDFCAIFKHKRGIRQANGTQILTGVCSNTPQGNIPKVENMPSTLILSPRNDQRIKVNKKFTIRVKISKLQTGFFSDPAVTYNTFPQELNGDGLIKGHSHVTVQFLGARGNQFPDANTFAFFKGLNDVAEDGVLFTDVAEGLPEPGVYRVCTIMSSFSHQYVVLPKAQRGASDDCVRFRVFK